MLSLYSVGRSQFFDANGDPLSGGLLYTYLPGTTTPKAAYTDKDGTTPHANPIVLDARGEEEIWLDGTYKFVLKNASGVAIWTADNHFGISSETLFADNIASLRAKSPTGTGRVYLKAHTAEGDGGNGFFRAVTGAAPGTYTDNGGTIIVPTGGDGSAAWIRDFKEVWLGLFGGGPSASAASNAVAIQAGIDLLYALGGGFLHLPEGVITSNPFVIKSGVILVGQGINATELKLANGANTDFITSLNFATLTGMNKWRTSDGVQHGLGFKSLRINGNKANQTAGDGVKLYAKRIIVDDVLIFDCFSVGWYSEAGDVAGQTDWTDLPESRIRLWVRNCGSHGFQFRGPHDAHIEHLITNQNGGDGASFERSAGVYSGSADVGFIHSYANTLKGININAAQQTRFVEAISESNYQEGVVCAGYYNQFSMLQMYNNCRTSGSFSLTVSGGENTFGDVQHKDSGSLKGGIQITGNKNLLKNIFLDGGNASTGVGIDVSGAYNQVQGHIDGFSGLGGTGLRTGNGVQMTQAKLDLAVNNCATVWNNASVGSLNSIRLTGYAAAGQTFFTGSGPNATDRNELWDINGYDSANNSRLSEIRKLSAGTIDLNSTAEQTITVGCTELLGLIPEPEDVTYGIYYAGTNTVWELAYLRLAAVSASLLTFKVKLRVAAGAAETAQIIATAKL